MNVPEKTKAAKVQIYKSRNPIKRQKWRFRCVAANGTKLTDSADSYVNVADALHAISLAHPLLHVEEI